MRCWRLIPAHAGKTNYLGPSHRLFRAHPRSRGENSSAGYEAYSLPGSSPLTRGKPGHGAPSCRESGLIPAHAGKTFALVLPTCQARAHPRSRGENGSPTRVRLGTSGSSPLTRGKLSKRLNTCITTGLIPAHAGKTTLKTLSLRTCRAHPRSRGENLQCKAQKPTIRGSSPLTRGKPGESSWSISPPGLIPAHAGKTCRQGAGFIVNRAHPRSRGENFISILDYYLLLGSSPLTRGKPLRRSGSNRPTRLIPAHAGKTLPDLRFYRADRSDLGKP